MLARRTLLAATAAAAVSPLSAARSQVAETKLDDTVGRGFAREVVIRWGDRVEADSPPFAPDRPSEAASAAQFGWDAKVLGLVGVPAGEDGVARALLAVAHPTADGRMMFPGGIDRPVDAVLAQGASILNLERHGHRWLVADGGFQSRRLTGRTLCRVTGPASADIADSAQGVLAVGAGCVTPWGTVLMAEGDPDPWFVRLGDRGPQLPRRQAALGYGWMVELDPADPQTMPAKRTLLGRFARSGVAASRSLDGRAVVYMSDDRADGHLFRFVSQMPVSPDNPDALDLGTLSVAAFDGYTLRWVSLPDAQASPLRLLELARRAGAARFDAPAGLAVGTGGVILLACRNAGGLEGLGASRLGPGNPDGKVLVLRPAGGDPAADRSDTEIALLGGNTGLGGAAMSQPDTLAMGPDGLVWIGTQASGVELVAPGSGSVSEVYRPPVGAVMGGVAVSPDASTVFSAVRHPGAQPSASFDRPGTRWPSLRPDMPPQTVIVGLTHDV